MDRREFLALVWSLAVAAIVLWKSIWPLTHATPRPAIAAR